MCEMREVLFDFPSERRTFERFKTLHYVFSTGREKKNTAFHWGSRVRQGDQNSSLSGGASFDLAQGNIISQSIICSEESMNE